MAKKWDRVRAAYDWLKQNNGQTITAADLAAAAGWTESTAKTYIGKLWAGILTPVDDQTYTIGLPKALPWEAFKSLHSQVVLSARSPNPTTFDYDVALSFAGEDRPIAEAVAAVLKAYSINVFYDAYEKHSLWGKDLYAHLDEVYRIRSRYCVIFISKDYKDKLWTNHERKAAQARAFKEQSEYILPVRLDTTELPGLHDTVAYLDGTATPPEEIARAIAMKLDKYDEFSELVDAIADFLGPNYEIHQDRGSLIFNCKPEDYTTTLSILMLLEAKRAGQLEYLMHSGIFVL